jgi:hypothetical protein
MNKISATATIAILLWGATAMTSLTRAQDKIGDLRASGSSLTNESLEEMLNGLGYEPKKLTHGFLIAIKRDTWTYNMQLLVSKDATKIGMNANLGQVPDPDGVGADKWKALLIANSDIDPSFFYFDKDQKKVYLHRVLDNRAVTAAYLRQQIDNFCTNIKDTSDAWSFTK